MAFTLCLGFKAMPDGSMAGQAAEFKALFKEVTGLEFDDVVQRVIADGGADGVQEFLKALGQHCSMHKLQLVAAEGIGKTGKSRSLLGMGPFAEGNAINVKVNNLSTHFSRRKEAKVEYKEHAAAFGCPSRPEHSRDMEQRMGGYCKQYTGTIQRKRAYKAYFDSNASDGAISKLELTSMEWETASEFEAVLHIIHSLIFLAQLENVFATVYNHLFGRYALRQLKCAVKVIDPDQDMCVQPANLKRVKQKNHVFTATGQTALNRMIFEVQATMAERPMDPAEQADIALDHRTINCPLYKHEEHAAAVEHLCAAYVAFGVQAAEYDAQVAAGAASSPAAAEKKPPAVSVDLSDSDSDGDCYVTFDGAGTQSAPNVNLAADLAVEFRRVYKNWRKCPEWMNGDVRCLGDHVVVDWRKLCVVRDGIRLDMGEFYSRLERQTSLYGHLPLMALARLAGLPSSSFNERVNSIAKKCMPPGRCTLSSVELGHVTTLRIDRKWMEHYRFLCKNLPPVAPSQASTLVNEPGAVKSEPAAPPPPAAKDTKRFA